MTLSAEKVKEAARKVGFSACGLAPAKAVSEERAREYRNWIAEGRHADMEYLSRNVEKKLNPTLLVEGARTVVSVAVNYFTKDTVESGKTHDETDKNGWCIARYARGTDYHEVVKQMLRRMLAELHLEEGSDGRCFVDTAPVDEKYWAQQCGLGWRGRNSQLIIPQAGSFFFLGELILTHEADRYDTPALSHCGTCHACLDACPTHALLGDGTLDARRCLSYLTIEHRGELPADCGDKMGDCFYGCDRCAEACPWNARFATDTEIEDLKPREAILCMERSDWETLTVEKYQALFRKSAVKRAKFEGLKRNIDAIRW